MAIKLDTFSSAGGGAGTDNLDDVTSRGATTTNAITVGGVTVGTEYTLPSADGSTNQYLKTDGAGNLSFADLDITGGLTYQGAFNATAGTPDISNAEKGDFYVIDTAGTIYGQTWAIGDHLLINADMGGTVTNSKIDKIDNTDQVTSVNGNTGAVVLSGDDLAADHTAVNYTATNANVDGHFSGVDTKLGTLLADITGESLNDLSDVSFTAGPGIDNYVLTYDNGTSSWGAEAVPSAPVTSVNTLTGAVVVSGNDIAADHTATNYTATNANVDGHFSGVDTKLGTLLADITGESLNDLSDVSFTAGPGIDNYVLTYDNGTSSWGAEVVPSAPVTSVNSLTGAVVVSGNDIAADHTATNYTAANANIDGHFSGVDTKLGTLGTSAFLDVGTSASNVVQLDGTAKLPAVDGSQLTNLPSAPVTSVNTLTGAVVVSGNDIVADHTAVNYTAANANVDGHFSGVDTKLGTLGTSAFLDVGTSASNVVQLDGTAKLPAVDGSQLTNLPSAPVTSVNSLTGAVVVSGNDIAADHTATNYTAANANVDGHFSGIDTKFGTLGTASTAASTDFLQVTNNLSDLNNAATARTNLGLGSAATSASTDFLQVTNNLSDLNNATTARTNLGLGTAATQNVGTSANNVVQLDGTAKLPAVDGSQLTNLPSAPVTSVNTLTGAVVVSGNDIAADHTAVNYTATNANIDGHLSGIDTALGSASGSKPTVTSASPGTDYTISTSSGIEEVYILNPSAAINVNLPSASTATSGYKYNIKNVSATHSLTVDPNSTETIDGATTYTLNVQYQSLTIVSDGSNWHII